MQVDVQNLQTRIPLSPHRIASKIKIFLRREGLKKVDLCVAIVSDRRIRSLNKKYLHHDYATDVLAFNFQEGSRGKSGKIYGDVIVSAETAKRQAKRLGVSIADELLLYVIHGVLHLLGFDDHRVPDMRRMRAKEKSVLDSLTKK